jgi:hypothetical protein
MRAITLMQPWAQLVAVGAKRYETRSWKTHYRGPLAIHASLEFPNSARALCRAEPFCSALFGNVDLPLGCVVAVCDLAAVLPTTESESLFESISEWPPSELPFGDFSPGRFAWLLKNIRALENPIPARGARSLWEWDELALGLLSDTNTQNKNHNMKTKKTTHQFRQGDVLIERVPSLPSVKPATPSDRVILAHGEVTGHAHEMSPAMSASLHEIAEAVRLVGDLPDADTMTQSGLVISSPGSVVHQEHASIDLAPGEYIVRRQREYSPEAIRNVAD